MPLLSGGAVTKWANIYLWLLSINKGQPLKLVLNGVQMILLNLYTPSFKKSLIAEVLGEDKE